MCNVRRSPPYWTVESAQQDHITSREPQSFDYFRNPNQTHLTSFDNIINSCTEILNKLKADAAANIPYRPYQFDVGNVLEQNTELLRFLREGIEPTRFSENILPETSQQQKYNQEPCGERTNWATVVSYCRGIENRLFSLQNG